MTRRALGMSILCNLLISPAGAQDQPALDKTVRAPSYAAGWGGGFQGRPWFDPGWRDQSGSPLDPRWYGFSGNPVWGYDSIQPKVDESTRQTRKVIVFIPKRAAPGAPRPPAPEPARAELREYTWPNSGGHPVATFSIALKTGTVRPAVAVCVQEDSILYVAPDGSGDRIPLQLVDTAATRSLNVKKDLRLWLPGDDRFGKSP